MTSKKKIQKIAHDLFKKSLTAGYVNDVKVQKILRIASSEKNPEIIKVLRIYKNLIKRTLAQEEVLVETAFPITQKEEKTLLEKTHAKRVEYKINPGIILGAKITHGDWVYDATLDAKLKQLTTDINY